MMRSITSLASEFELLDLLRRGLRAAILTCLLLCSLFSVMLEDKENRYAHVFSLLLRLRMLCDHRSLVPPLLLNMVKDVMGRTTDGSAGESGLLASHELI
jgi:SNF2 family DNA or RNA helicase